VATASEIKEDFWYLFLLELALILGVTGNCIYAGDFESALIYFLIFIGVIISERLVEKALLIGKERNLRVKFEWIYREKHNAKRSAVLLLITLIILSSWGIISYIAKFQRYFRDYARIVTMVLPWYVAIYTIWLIYLIYLKHRYMKFLLSLLSKKKNWGKITRIILMVDAKKIIDLSSENLDRKTESIILKEIADGKMDFKLGNYIVMVEIKEPLKLAVVTNGEIKSKQDLRIKMKDALKAIKIAHPKKIEDGNFTESEKEEIKNLLKRYILAEKVL